MQQLTPSPRGREVVSGLKRQSSPRRGPLEQHKPLIRRPEENDEAMQRFYLTALAKQAAKTQWAQEEQAKRAQREAQADAEACTFQPRVSERVASMRRPGALSPQFRIYDEQRLKRERLALAARKKDAEELRGCTFRPITLESAKVKPDAFAIRTDRHAALYEHAMDRVAFRKDILPKAAETILMEADMAREQQQRRGDLLFAQSRKQPRSASPLVQEEVEDMLDRIAKHRSPQYERRLFLRQVEREKAAKKRVQARNEDYRRRRSRSQSHRDPHLGDEGRHLVRSHSRGDNPRHDAIEEVSTMTPSDSNVDRNGPTSSSLTDGEVSPIPGHRRPLDDSSSMDDSTYYKLHPHEVRINRRSESIAKDRAATGASSQDVVERLLNLPAKSNGGRPPQPDCTFTPRVSPGSAAIVLAKRVEELRLIVATMMGSPEVVPPFVPVVPLARAILSQLARSDDSDEATNVALLDAADVLVEGLQGTDAEAIDVSAFASSVVPHLSHNAIYLIQRRLGIHHPTNTNRAVNPKNNNKFEEPTYRPALSAGTKNILATRDEGAAKAALAARRGRLERERLEREEAIEREYTHHPTINKAPKKGLRAETGIRSDEGNREHSEGEGGRRRSGTQLHETDPPTLRGDVVPPPAASDTHHFEDIRSFSPASTRAAPHPQTGGHARPKSQSLGPSSSPSPAAARAPSNQPPTHLDHLPRAERLRVMNEHAQRVLHQPPSGNGNDRRDSYDGEMPDELIRDLQAAISALNAPAQPTTTTTSAAAALYPPATLHNTHLPIPSESRLQHGSYLAAQQHRRAYVAQQQVAAALQREQQRVQEQRRRPVPAQQATLGPGSDGHFDDLRRQLQSRRHNLQ